MTLFEFNNVMYLGLDYSAFYYPMDDTALNIYISYINNQHNYFRKYRMVVSSPFGI